MTLTATISPSLGLNRNANKESEEPFVRSVPIVTILTKIAKWKKRQTHSTKCCHFGSASLQ